MEWTFLFAVVTNFITEKWILLGAGLAITLAAYVYFGIYKKLFFKMLKQNLFLTLFVIYGCACALLSFVNILQYFNLTKALDFDIKYIPRQAFYLAFLPLLALIPLLDASKGAAFIKKHRFNIMLAFYVLNIIVYRSAEVNVQTLFILCFLSLTCGHEVKLKDWVYLVCLILLPVDINGNSTCFLLKIIYVGVFICYNKLQWKKAVKIFSSFTIPLILVYSFVFPMFPNLVAKIPDVNIRWRLEFWQEEMSAFKETYGLGVGYGTTYVSRDFVEEHAVEIPAKKCPYCNGILKESELSKGPFAKEPSYTEEEKRYVVASHNSFVTIAFRTGIIGIVLFCAALVCIWKRLLKNSDDDFGVKAFLFCGILFIISLNVGLENPGYLRLFIFAMCAAGANINFDAEGEKLEQ